MGVTGRNVATHEKFAAERPGPRLRLFASPMELRLAVLLSATTVLLLGLVAGYVKNRLWISEPVICTGIGLLLGPIGLDLVELDTSDSTQTLVLQEIARSTVAVAAMGAALRLPPSYWRRSWRELAVTLGLGMPLMWGAGAALAWVLLPTSLLPALLIGAVVTPTDPVLSAPIVTGRIAERNVPRSLRDSLSAESGANDGLALPIVMIPLLLLTGHSLDETFERWFVEVLLIDIVAAALVGLTTGWLAGLCYVWARRQPFTEPPSILTIALALTITVAAAVRLFGGSGILGVFVAGSAFNVILAEEEGERLERIQEAFARFLDLPVFIVLGALAPWHAWTQLGWSGPLFALAVLALRRPPAWLLLRYGVPSLRSRRDALFAGWFGPVGIAAMFYALKAHADTGLEIVWPAVSLVIVASVLAHGISATPLTLRFGRACRHHGGQERSDSSPSSYGS